MKKLVLLPLVSLALVACDDNAEKQRQQQYAQQQQMMAQQQQMMAQQQQYAQPIQPQVVQPQVIQAPAQPVVVQQHSDNTLTNMALGAMIGHTIANMGNSNDSRPTERIVEHKTVIIDNRSPQPTPVQSLNTPATPSSTPTPVAPIAPATPVAKTSAMDMNKLSASANQTFNTGTPSSAPVARSSAMDMSKMSGSSVPSPAPKTSSMDMNRLSSRPPVNLAKPSSSMNMSKLSRR